MASRQKLENEHASIAFKIANDVYNKKMTHTEGKNFLVSNFNFNANTAGDLINDFRYLMQAESYERTLNAFYTDYFLKNIHHIYSSEGLRNALVALEKHINYYEGHYKTIMHKLRAVLTTFKSKLDNSRDDMLEQEAIELEIKKVNTKEELLVQIKRLETIETEIVTIKGVSFKRRNWIITLIKKLRNHRCQICDIGILKKSGGFYIEAAHITPKCNGGSESLENIILLCPNHHKEFDLGEVKIMERRSDLVSLVMNGKQYSIALTTE
jgi:5-methylcytosine-specific restriction protein A